MGFGRCCGWEVVKPLLATTFQPALLYFLFPFPRLC